MALSFPEKKTKCKSGFLLKFWYNDTNVWYRYTYTEDEEDADEVHVACLLCSCHFLAQIELKSHYSSEHSECTYISKK